MKNSSLCQKHLGVVSVCLLSSFSCLSQEYEKQLPNIVYILADDMGVGDLSCYNKDSKIHTRHLDEFASQGMRFTDAHSAASVCTPTRYGIMTGRYPWRSELKAKVVSGYDPCLIPPERETVAKLARRNGYKTAMIGKWHLGMDWQTKEGSEITEVKNDIQKTEEKIDFSKPVTNGPLEAGFDYFYGIAASWDFPPYIFMENSMLTEAPKIKRGGRLLIDYYPDVPKEELLEKNRDYPLVSWRKGYASESIGPKDAVKLITERSIEYVAEQKNNQPFFLMIDYTAPHSPVAPNDEFLGKSDCGIYGDFCLELDFSVGKIIDQLREKNLFSNTLVIFTADNGASLRSIPMAKQKEFTHSPSYIYKGYKARLDEGGHRIPFIAVWPGKIAPGTVNNGPITLNDLYATLAEITDTPVDANAGEDSFSILKMLVKGDTINPQREVMVHTDFAGYFAIRHEQWKLIYHRDEEKIALYNIWEDPSETNNVIEKFPEVKQELTEELTRAVKDGRTTPGPVLKNDGPEYWEQLYWMKEE